MMLRNSNYLLKFQGWCFLHSFALRWVLASSASADAPSLTNTPIVRVQKELYKQHEQAGVGVAVQQFRYGPGLRRLELVRDEAISDAAVNFRIRFSDDNGRNWGPFTQLPDSYVDYQGVPVWEGVDNSYPLYDPVADVLIVPWLRMMELDGRRHSFTYYCISHDLGRTWSKPKQLKYEAGADFDPANPTKTSTDTGQSFLNRNEAFVGMNFVATSDGKIIMGIGMANDPTKTDDQNNQDEYRTGALNFIGTWNPTRKDYDWVAGKQIGFSAKKSSRGLLETDTAQLTDGRILNVWRGSNKKIREAGRKWFSVSTDGGMTMSPVQELKYDDGTSFFSPSSMNRLIRHSITGKLYLIGNIVPTNPNANSPRYPLVIAEIDETKVALKRSTVTPIAEKLPEQMDTVQYSNFSVLENPESHTLEIFLSDWGAKANLFDADAYKYTLEFLPANPNPQ